MEKRTEGEPQQSKETKKSNLKIWLCIISVALSLAIVAVACFGVALFSLNGKTSTLLDNLNTTNKKLETITKDNQTRASEIEALKNSQSALESEIEAELEALASELASLKDLLEQSNAEKVELENSLEALKSANQSEVDQLKSQMKSDIEKAQAEISALKEQLKEQGTDAGTDGEDKIRIYIDQGHNPTSYHNSGATANGLYEQDVTFLVGRLLAEYLKTDGRFEVQLSRPNKSVVLGTDNKSSLMARVEGAAAFNADYLISLHTNSFDQDTAKGIEVYVANKTGEAYVFGETLLNGLIESTNLNNRGMKENSEFDILEYSTMPAVLVELGFITNATDAALLGEHPELFAKGMYDGILDYFGFLPNTTAAT